MNPTPSPVEANPPRVPRWIAFAASLGAYVVPYALSRSTSPSPDHPRVLAWYLSLRKPAFQPPSVAIPATWIAIETGLAVAAYRLIRRPSSAPRSASLYWLAGNVAAIGAWSRLFFGSRHLGASTIAAAALVGTGAAYVAQSRRVDAPAAAAGVALTAWVAFATVLTAAIWQRNRR